jgi:quercetin dioxygenase-like cupin family protein
MKTYRYEDMKGGWFVGDFLPTAYQTSAFEVSLKVHPKGEQWEWHYHEHLTEVNLLIRGLMTIQWRTLVDGDIFVLDPGEIADPVFLADCEIVCVKVPSVPGDKVVVQRP